MLLLDPSIKDSFRVLLNDSDPANAAACCAFGSRFGNGKISLSGKAVGVGKLCGRRGPGQNLPHRPAGSKPNQPALYALKMLLPDWQNDAQAIRLLKREALVGQSVSHPHLIPILYASVQQSPRFVVMPWLEGATLEQRLAAGQRFDLPAGFMDRPANGRGPRCPAPGRLDARRRETQQHHALARWPCNALGPWFRPALDETGSAVDRCVLGTFHYIAPEFLTSAIRADIRSDIYSLGAVLYRILAGRLPFKARIWPNWPRSTSNRSRPISAA